LTAATYSGLQLVASNISICDITLLFIIMHHCKGKNNLRKKSKEKP
jgi:hypothetical protein